MWFFRKKQTLEESGFFRGFTDWHSHILPGVDDGVQTMEEALQILSEYECRVTISLYRKCNSPFSRRKHAR